MRDTDTLAYSAFSKTKVRLLGYHDGKWVEVDEADVDAASRNGDDDEWEGSGEVSRESRQGQTMVLFKVTRDMQS